MALARAVGNRGVVARVEDDQALRVVDDPHADRNRDVARLLLRDRRDQPLDVGIDGISPWMLNGPNMPLVVQNTFTCANAADGTMHSMPSTTAAIPSFLMASSPQSWFVVVRTLVPDLSTHWRART